MEINLKILNKYSIQPRFWAKLIGFTIPILFLVYVIYANFLPFGYHRSFVIDIGSSSDTKSNEFYLEPSLNLSDRKINDNGDSYREMNGIAFAVFKPKVVLNNTKISAEIKGTGASLVPPYINFNLSSIPWDYAWNFTKEIPKDLSSQDNKVFIFDNGAYFNGSTELKLPDSSDKIENSPFTIYVEWLPADDDHDFQQIVGHYNWEILQEKNKVRFNIGRMNDRNGPFFSVDHIINDTSKFFNNKHRLVAIYSPSEKNGYIEMFIDDKFAGRTNIGSNKIYADYNNKVDLSFGKSKHGVANFFTGTLYKVNIIERRIVSDREKISFYAKGDDKIYLPIVAGATSTIDRLVINVSKN